MVTSLGRAAAIQAGSDGSSEVQRDAGKLVRTVSLRVLTAWCKGSGRGPLPRRRNVLYPSLQWGAGPTPDARPDPSNCQPKRRPDPPRYVLGPNPTRLRHHPPRLFELAALGALNRVGEPCQRPAGIAATNDEEHRHEHDSKRPITAHPYPPCAESSRPGVTRSTARMAVSRTARY